LHMSKDQLGRSKLEAVDYRNTNEESPPLKRAGWRGKQMSETVPPIAEVVTVGRPEDTLEPFVIPLPEDTIDLPPSSELTGDPDWLP
jgi:hypothetical protein